MSSKPIQMREKDSTIVHTGEKDITSIHTEEDVNKQMQTGERQ